MSGFKDDSWILISASTVNLLQYDIPGEVYEENFASYRYVIGKGRSMLIAFQLTLDIILWYYSKIQHVVASQSYLKCGIWNPINQLFSVTLLCYNKIH